jgi:RNA polymerase sigma factor (sigma-70 family)
VARRDLVVVTDIDADDARRVLRALSVQQRAVMYLTYWHDWDPARIAEALGVADGTVRKQLARGREQLREALRDE